MSSQLNNPRSAPRIWIPFLLLIGVLIGFSLSRFVTERSPSKSDRPSPFSYLEVNDPSLVHVRRGTHEQPTDYDYEPADQLSWQMYLPEGKQWNLCWAFGKFPRDGVPTASAGLRRLASTKPGEHPQLFIQFFGSVEAGWSARIGYGDVAPGTYKTWLVPVPDTQGPAVWNASQSFVTAAGEDPKIDGWIAQTFTGEEPIVLLRLGELNMSGGAGTIPSTVSSFGSSKPATVKGPPTQTT